MTGLVRSSVPAPADLPQQVAAALAEDIGSGDLTAALIAAEQTGRATVITREPAIVCGAPYVEESFRQVDSRVGSNGGWPKATACRPISACSRSRARRARY